MFTNNNKSLFFHNFINIVNRNTFRIYSTTNLKTISTIINQIIAIGVNPSVLLEDKNDTLKKYLIEIYFHFLHVKPEFDDNDYDYEDAPNFDYNLIRRNVSNNFPNFGWYSTITDLNEILENSDITIGDAIDDLSDIIKDLLEIKWRFEKTSELDAIWHFELLMRIHSEQHLIDLLKYLKEKKV